MERHCDGGDDDGGGSWRCYEHFGSFGGRFERVLGAVVEVVKSEEQGEEGMGNNSSCSVVEVALGMVRRTSS